MKKKLVVKIGISSLEMPMTETQALRYGKNAMPMDLRKAGFVCSVFHASQELHGTEHYRINYSKKDC